VLLIAHSSTRGKPAPVRSKRPRGQG
jgi:hypothetical protein